MLLRAQVPVVGNGPLFTADGHALSAPLSLLNTGGVFSPDARWADFDHVEVPADNRVQFVSVPWTLSGFAARLEARNGEHAASGDAGVDRVEFSAVGLGDAAAQGWGDGTDMWWATTIMPDPAFALPTKSGIAIWHLVHQFYAQNWAGGAVGTSGGSPPFDIEFMSSGKWLITMRGGAKATSGAAAPINYAWGVGNTPAEVGVPHDFLIRYRYSSGPDGQLQVWYRKRGNQFPGFPQVNLHAGQTITAPTDGSSAGGVGAGPAIATGVTAITVGSEVISYYPETGIYRQTPDASPAATVVYQGGLVGRHTRAEAEEFWGPTNGGSSHEKIALDAQGLLSETGDPGLYITGTAPLTQTVYGRLLGLRAGELVTGVVLQNTIAAAGTLPTTVRFGIADATGKILAISGNLNALASWFQGKCFFPFTAPYKALLDGGFFPCFVVNGVWGTTQPTPLRGAGGIYSNVGLAGKAPSGFSWAGQTDLPAVGASLTIVTGATYAYYMGFY